MKRFLLLSLLAFTFAFPAYAESTYDRVMKAGKIRCGYGLWSIYLAREPNTGKMSGIFYDYMEEMGKNLSLKIEWAEEVGDGEAITALETGRIDAYCSILFWNAERARTADFVEPLFYSGTFAFARAGDTRFDGNLAAINKPEVKIISVDGDIFAKIVKLEFPQATSVSLPQITTEAETFLTLAGGKADILLNEPYAAADFMKNNPNKIQRVALGPIRYSPSSLMIKGGEDRFRRMLDIATVEMHGNGAVEKIISKYEEYDDAILRVAKPYEARP